MRTRSSIRLSGGVVALLVVVALVIGGATIGQAAQSTPEATAPIRIVWPAPDAEVIGRDVSVSWQAPGYRIVPAAQAENETDYHVHFIVDGAYEAVEGAPIPQQCGVLHTAANPAVYWSFHPANTPSSWSLPTRAMFPSPDWIDHRSALRSPRIQTRSASPHQRTASRSPGRTWRLHGRRRD